MKPSPRSAPGRSPVVRLRALGGLLGLLGLVLGLGSCDGSPLLFPSPEGLVVVSGNGSGGTFQGTVGEVLLPAAVLRVVDGRGNPVPNATVRLDVEAGGGAVTRTEIASDRQGRVTVDAWRLGDTAGANRLRVRVDAHGGTSLGGSAAPEFLLEAEGVPGAASRIVPVGAPLPVLEGTVGETLSTDLRFRLEDRFGNPVPGVSVTFGLPTGSGTLAAMTDESDSAGEVTPGSWTLGPETGLQALRVVAVGVVGVALEVEALARPGAPDRIRVEGELPARAPVGVSLSAFLEVLPILQVVDAFGNPLPDLEISVTPLANSGSVAAPTVNTGPTGTGGTLPDWTLGETSGPQGLRLAAPGAPAVPPLELLLEAVRAGDLWEVDAVHVNQGNQTFQGTVPLVAGRPGLLRIFLGGNSASQPGVRVRIQLRQGGNVVLDEVVGRSGGGGIESTEPNLDDAGSSWNLPLAGHLLQVGTELRLEVDPDEVLDPAPSPALTWPADGGWQTLDVRALPTFRATFIPIQVTYFGLTGRITPANLQEYVGSTVDQFPIGEVDFEVRTTPLVFDGSFENAGSAWVAVLQDVRDLRLAESGFARYYHGILQRPSGPGIAGIAYVATQPQGINNLAAVSFDELPTAGPVIAHEFGHNFGRNHAPCGNVSGVDPNYPHPGGELGGPGYSAATGTLRSTTGFRDVMGYCFPFWASDYTFGAIRAMREVRPVGISLGTLVGAQPAPRAGTQAAILVGGSWSSTSAPSLRPAIRLDARPSPPDPGGEVLVQLLDAGGVVVASGRYPAVRVDHADDPTLRHFGAVLGLPAGSGPVASIRVTTPAGVASLASGPAAVDLAGPALVTVDAAPPPAGIREPAESGAWTRIRWDVETFPVLVLRDAQTGSIRGFLRSGDALVPPSSSVDDLPRLRIDLSDGVQTLQSVRTRRGPGLP